MTVNTPQNTQHKQTDELSFGITLAIVFLLVFAVFMLIFSLTYIKDIQMLRDVPNLIWNWACGQPIDNETTLPLLLTLSILAFAISGILYGWQWWRRKTTAPAPANLNDSQQ